VDLVVALYNPRSTKRVRQLEEAVAILRAARSGETPVGIVTDAGQDEQSLLITDLTHVLGHKITMRSIVIVGNRATQVIDGWMVTARGYLI
jgi:precorrin-3B methylase